MLIRSVTADLKNSVLEEEGHQNAQPSCIRTKLETNEFREREPEIA